MEILLKNYERENEVLNFNTKELYTSNPYIKTCGWYKYLESEISALFYFNSAFTIYFNKNSIKLNDNVKASVEKNNDLKTFKLIDKGNLVLSFNYKSHPDFDIMDSNLFGFVEEEDFDWGLFLKNIINNSERRENIISSLLNRK